MANTYTCLHYHIIFSTKHREPWLRADIEERVWTYLGGIAHENGVHPVCVGGFDDHIHILVRIPPALAVSDVVKQIKGGSSKWIKTALPGFVSFAWQDGYGAFAVSKSQVPDVERYIREQREHHRARSFQEEYRVFLERNGIVYKEEYLWD
jgi:Transposase and inactivated derivatives